MLKSRWLCASAVAASIGLAFAAPQAGTAAQAGPPSLKLISVLKHTAVERFGGDKTIYLSPGVYVAAVDGAFEIDASRNPDGSVALWQVTRDTHGVRRVRQLNPGAKVRFDAGLPKFFHVVITDSHGKAVLARNLPFCLDDGYGLARVDASGPDTSGYPYGCGGPLTQGAVWGIDRGWASGISLAMRFAAPDGKYSLHLAIGQSYVDQLGIPAAAASATVALTVTTQNGGTCGVRIGCPVVVGRQASVRASGEIPIGETGGQATTRTLPQDQPAQDPLQHASGVPDLRALPAHDLSITHNRHTGRDYLDFGATIWNAGSGPLVVEGFRSGPTALMPATQFIYRDGHPVSSKAVGQFEFDNRRGHHHWHMEDIAQYDLLDKSGNRLLLSDKQSFCLAPTDEIDLTLPGADWQADQAGLWSACEGGDAIWLREVLPAGWGDTYYQSVAGQSFNITGLANGRYRIRVTADPRNALEETAYDNNVGLVTIRLGGTPGHRTVTVVG